MRKVSRFLRKRLNNLYWYNYYLHLWYSYHIIFFGSLIFRGRKLWAFNSFLLIKQGLKYKEKYDPSLVFLISMLKITPNILLLPVKKSGIISGVPFPISPRKQVTFAVRWVLKLLKDSNRVIEIFKVVDLMVSAIYGRGDSIKKKKEVYKRASLNRHLINFYR